MEPAYSGMPGDLGPGVLRIGQEADLDLEQLQGQPDQVEPEDHRDLPARLQPQQVEDRRHDQPVRQQCVEPGDRQRNVGSRQAHEDGDREEAALQLHPSEAEKLDQR